MSHHLTSHLRGTRASLLALAVAGALLGVMLVSRARQPTASTTARAGSPAATAARARTTRSTANIAYDGTGSNAYVCDRPRPTPPATASAAGAAATAYAESCYAGNQLLHGWLGNDSPYWLYMYGTEYYSQGCP